jgi:uncharacterized membrane protein
MTQTCIECGRTFDLLDEEQAAEWSYGHDCEEQRYPCREAGHFDCASTEGGSCEAEKYARLMVTQ